MILKHIPKIPSIVTNIVGFIFGFIYECLFYIFLMWLSGGIFLNRTFCLIVTLHLFPMRLAHLLAGITDQWRINTILPHVLYVCLSIPMIIITLIYDIWMWPVTIFCVLKTLIVYLYLYLDGEAFINKVNHPHIKKHPYGMMVYCMLSATMFAWIPILITIVLFIVRPVLIDKKNCLRTFFPK